MLKRSFRRSGYLLFFAVVVLVVATYVWYPSPLIVPWEETGFVDSTEDVFALLLAVFCSFLLPNRYEIELSLTCGYPTSRLAFSRLLPVLVDTLAGAFLTLALYRYTSYNGMNKPHIPIVIPEHMKAYLAVSFLVTALFFTALFFFVRVLVRNCYLSVACCLFLERLFSAMGKSVQQGVADITRCRFDPFISVYMISDKLPNALAEQYTELSGLAHVWTYNRILFFVLALLLFGAAYLVLQREHLHKGFGE